MISVKTIIMFKASLLLIVLCAVVVVRVGVGHIFNDEDQIVSSGCFANRLMKHDAHLHRLRFQCVCVCVCVFAMLRVDNDLKLETHAKLISQSSTAVA